MNQCIDVQNQFVSDRKPNCNENESVLEVLYEVYSERCSFNNGTIQSAFQDLNTMISGLSIQKSDQLIDSVCDICREYGRVGFMEGIKAGVRLKEELE